MAGGQGAPGVVERARARHVLPPAVHSNVDGGPRARNPQEANSVQSVVGGSAAFAEGW
jgi:hypothetical protein